MDGLIRAACIAALLVRGIALTHVIDGSAETATKVVSLIAMGVFLWRQSLQRDRK